MKVAITPGGVLAFEVPSNAGRNTELKQTICITNEGCTPVVFAVHSDSAAVVPANGRLDPEETKLVNVTCMAKTLKSHPSPQLRVQLQAVGIRTIQTSATKESTLRLILTGADQASALSDDKYTTGCLTGLRNLFKSKNVVSPLQTVPAQLGNVEIGSDADESSFEEKSGAIYYPCCMLPQDSETFWRMGKNEVQLPPYIMEGDADVYRPEVLKTIEKELDRINDDLRSLSLDIHSHPEIMFEEKYAHDTLTKFMEERGWDVTRHYKLETAWRAASTYHSKDMKDMSSVRVLGVNSEMDALPGIGHACGHNLIAIAGVGVALAVRHAIEVHNIAGTVVLLGTPAEEGGQGKAKLIDMGAYKEMDACVMSHPGPGKPRESGLGPCLAMQGIEVEFFGHTAHASAAPWEGINAFDAAVLAYNNVSALRQQMPLDHRVHGVIKGPQDLAANVIPDYTRMLWYVRAPTYRQLKQFRSRVLNCFKAAALATSCTHKVQLHQAAFDLRQNTILAREYSRTLKNAFAWESTAGPGAIGGSTDFGNVTYEVPAIHPAYCMSGPLIALVARLFDTIAIPTVPNGGNHTAAFTAAAKTPEAHAATMVVAKALAHTAVRVLDDNEFYQEVKESFEKGEHLLLRS